MAKYHVNHETGQVGICRARRACPFGDLETGHYSTPEQARAAYEKEQTQVFETFRKSHVETVTSSYDFSAHKVDKAKAAIEKANRRAQKAGILDQFTYALRTYDVKHQDSQGNDYFEQRAELVLNRPVIQHDGWKFSGTLTWDEEVGMVSRLLPGETLLESPRAKECDVCHTNRHRVDTYLIQREDVQKQVGSNCLQQFMGMKPQGLWMLDYELKIDDHDDRSPLERWNDQRRDSVEALSLGLAVVETYGWQSRSGYSQQTPTADLVAEYFYRQDARRNDPAESATIDRLWRRAHELENSAAKIIEDIRASFPINDYMDNLKTVAAGETVSMRNLPVFLSSIAAVEREKREILRRETRGKSQWVGVKGDKIEGHKVTVASIKHIDNPYSYNSSSRLITMKDDEDNVLKWFSSGSAAIEEGESYIMRATVKDHEEYQGQKETLVTRAKLE